MDPSLVFSARFTWRDLGKSVDQWKARLSISKIAKFESATSKASEGIPPESFENLQTFSPCQKCFTQFKPFGNVLFQEVPYHLNVNATL